MKKAIQETQKSFESSSSRTSEYLAWHRLFKREFTQFLTSLGATKIEISKPNHFDTSGFFTSTKGQIWYFSISDIRWDKDTLLIRTAATYKDYTGGHNCFVPLNNVDDFTDGVKRLVIWQTRKLWYTSLMTTKQVSALLKTEDIRKNKGVFTYWSSYFFRTQGRSEDKLKQDVLRYVPNAVVIDSGDHYHGFVESAASGSPKDSFFWVKFQILSWQISVSWYCLNLGCQTVQKTDVG